MTVAEGFSLTLGMTGAEGFSLTLGMTAAIWYGWVFKNLRFLAGARNDSGRGFFADAQDGRYGKFSGIGSIKSFRGFWDHFLD
ncbi:MAG: hypothetical protein U5L07_06360 [Desulfobacterales bacterium]|nr:hypothetical protein [Desulfobacterales bacterium]